MQVDRGILSGNLHGKPGGGVRHRPLVEVHAHHLLGEEAEGLPRLHVGQPPARSFVRLIQGILKDIVVVLARIPVAEHSRQTIGSHSG